MNLWTPEAGTPQGAVISPLLSNIYLDALDHEMAHGASRWCGTRTTSWCCVKHGRSRAASAAAGRGTVDGLARTLEDTNRGRTQPAVSIFSVTTSSRVQWPRRKSERKFRQALKTDPAHARASRGHIIIMNRILGLVWVFPAWPRATFATLDG